MGQKDQSDLDKIRAEAAEWVVRLSDDGCTPADEAQFVAWREQSPHHEVAYERAAAAWSAFDRLRVYGGSKVDADVLAAKAPSFFQVNIRKIAAGIALSAGLATAAIIAGTAPAAYATGLGERRVVVLEDGSAIELNTDSKVLVRYRQRVREVTLVRGEALFHPTEDERPFLVVAEAARLSAGGSEVTVRLLDDGPLIRVNEGEAQLSAAGGTMTLDSGSEVAVGPAGLAVREISEAELTRTLAWRQGSIVLDGQSLGEAVQEFNRYNQQKLVVSDADLGSLRLGGYFRTSDVAGFVSALTKTFPVAAATAGDGRIYLKRVAQGDAEPGKTPTGS